MLPEALINLEASGHRLDLTEEAVTHLASIYRQVGLPGTTAQHSSLLELVSPDAHCYEIL